MFGLRFFALAVMAPVLASPARRLVTTPNAVYPSALFDRGINDCYDSSFIDMTSGASPTVNDCLQIVTNIQGDGTWTMESEDYRVLVRYGSCAMDALTQGPVPALLVHIGNQDIQDIITSSVDQFKSPDGLLVGSKGIMPCQTAGGRDIDVYWGVFNTDHEKKTNWSDVFPNRDFS